MRLLNVFACRDLTRYANAYLEDELPALTRLRVRVHLLICRNCRRYLRQLRQTIALLGSAFPALSPTREAELVEVFRHTGKLH